MLYLKMDEAPPQSLGEILAEFNSLEYLEKALENHSLKEIICTVYNSSSEKVDGVPLLKEGEGFSDNIRKILTARGDDAMSPPDAVEACLKLIGDVDSGKSDITLPDYSTIENITLISEDYTKFKHLNFYGKM